MNKIAICIPTYKRPILLRKLVKSISTCHIFGKLIKEVIIIIVDNDISKSAEEVVNSLKVNLDSIFKIFYESYPVKGLSNVRNELLRIAFKQNPHFIVFIDDDEFVTSEWLNELVVTMIVNDGDMVMGPVSSLFDENISRYISRWINRPLHLNNSKLDFIRTGNLILKTKTLLEYNVWFDNRFNTTGGEDSYFGVKMISKGATVYWAAGAVAYESVPAKRANIRWLFKRYYNGANIFTRILRIEKQYWKLLKKLVVSLIYLVSGAGSCVIIIIPVTFRYWGVLKFAEGMGGITGFFKIDYHEYR